MTSKRHKRRTSRKPGRRNRKLHSQGFQVPVRTTLMGVAAAGALVFYLLLCSRTDALAGRIKTEEHELEQLRRQVAGEEVRWNDMIGPRSLRAALREHELEMSWPRHDQVVHIRDMALWESGSGESSLYSRVENQTTGGVQVP